MISALNPVLLAVEEGVPPDHIAATLVPAAGFLFFCGSVYILLWSIYGAKKGALVYGTAFFMFGMLIGVYWWFGAPGTPVATGVRFFPGQETDRYEPKWFAMEPGSERAGFFDVTNSLEEFQTPAAFLGLEGLSQAQLEANPAYSKLSGRLSQAAERMMSVYLPTPEGGSPLIGAQRRQRLMEEAGQPETGEQPASPFFTARVAPDEEGEGTILVTEDQGLRVAGATLQVVANYVPTEAGRSPREVVVEEANFFAFEDPGAIWFPSAVWTVAMGLAMLLCLLGLDRMEVREKATVREREPVEAGV